MKVLQTAAAAALVLRRLRPAHVRRSNSASKRPRQAISGMIVTIILIGIVVSIGGIIATTTTDLVQTGLVLDAVEIKRLNIQNTGTESYITGMIKNAGNTDLTDVMVIVTLDKTYPEISDMDKDSVFAVAFTDRLNSGVSATVNEKIFAGKGSTTDADLDADPVVYSSTTKATGSNANQPVRLSIGEEVLVEIRAEIEGGGQYSQTKVLTPQ